MTNENGTDNKLCQTKKSSFAVKLYHDNYKIFDDDDDDNDGNDSK